MACCVFITFSMFLAVLPTPLLSMKFERISKQIRLLKKKGDKWKNITNNYLKLTWDLQES